MTCPKCEREMTQVPDACPDYDGGMIHCAVYHSKMVCRDCPGKPKEKECNHFQLAGSDVCTGCIIEAAMKEKVCPTCKTCPTCGEGKKVSGLRWVCYGGSSCPEFDGTVSGHTHTC